ncbi:MAG: hypothetical protein II858_06960 [Bacteroidales bacterium]|nr:hypothetical protein [Bacteroidales bacterium]
MVKKSYDAPVLEVFEIGVNLLSQQSGIVPPETPPNAFPGGGENWDNDYDI